MTKVLMTVSAMVLGIIGILFSFVPDEIITYLIVESNTITILLFQLMGALYLGFAILNWMAKGSIIGGIYNKPIVIGNFMHFGVGALALIKIVFVGTMQIIIIPLTVGYTLFAISFAYIFLVNPSNLGKEK